MSRSSLLHHVLPHPPLARAVAHAARRAYVTEPTSGTSEGLELPPNKRRRLEGLATDEALVRPPSRQYVSTQNILNRTGAIEPEMHRELGDIVRSFRAPIRHAFAYGSAVFKQKGYTQADKPMIDFIFAVSEPVQWHALNLRQNGHHYATLPRILGSNFISHLQQGYGGKVWFNVECEVNGRLIKYGVISVKQLTDDLRDWDTLYVSGRMHKPVGMVHLGFVCPDERAAQIHILRDDPRIRLHEEVNLKSALRTALLLLPERFTEADLYRQITSLSYQGDFRMRVGENPGKIGNIVAAQYDRFATLYTPFFTSTSFASVLARPSPGSDHFELDASPRARGAMARKLPSGLRDRLQAAIERTQRLGTATGRDAAEEPTGADEAARWTKIAKDADFQSQLSKSLTDIVSGPAFYQSVKGVVSVGFTKGVRYVGPKLRKRWLPSSSS